ncbi:MAG TPA: HypC/HybG/HupF family hydrogenase formation chaperone, partial [Solirubrobacteraceae bacterium]|nr:HypC/HybG/HupF family hydrogenase formation chaperone [Solirubrobacteraceae bacterium]
MSAEPRSSAEPHCVTCADAAKRMRVLELDPARALAVCADERGRRRSVDVGLVEPVAAGDTLLVHAGTALHREP